MTIRGREYCSENESLTTSGATGIGVEFRLGNRDRRALHGLELACRDSKEGKHGGCALSNLEGVRLAPLNRRMFMEEGDELQELFAFACVAEGVSLCLIEARTGARANRISLLPVVHFTTTPNTRIMAIKQLEGELDHCL